MLNVPRDAVPPVSVRARCTTSAASPAAASVRSASGRSSRPAAGWEVTTSDGERHTYDGVIVANGHLWDPFVPDDPGHFDGRVLHSGRYRNVRDLDGDRVLVVGAGNSGCDLAVDAAQAGHETDVSVRNGLVFQPKTLFGRPRSELPLLGRLPIRLQERISRGLIDDGWHATMAVNATGVFYGMRAAIPALRRNGGGSIINIASIYGPVGAPGYVAYTASKGAVIAMTKVAALEHAQDRIRVNAICPGPVRTPMSEQEGDASVDITPLRRRAEPEEISSAVAFLASDDAIYITGAELAVDGGYLAR